MEIDDFAVRHLFRHLPGDATRDEAWYGKCIDGDGWIVVWSNGECFHTYRDPGDWY